MNQGLVGEYLQMNYLQEYLTNQEYSRSKEKIFPSKICIEQNFEPYVLAKHHKIFPTLIKVKLYWQSYVNFTLIFFTEIVALLAPLQLIKYQLIFTMSLIMTFSSQILNIVKTMYNYHIMLCQHQVSHCFMMHYLDLLHSVFLTF